MAVLFMWYLLASEILFTRGQVPRDTAHAEAGAQGWINECNVAKRAAPECGTVLRLARARMCKAYRTTADPVPCHGDAVTGGSPSLGWR
jgi:hypothetical protein